MLIVLTSLGHAPLIGSIAALIFCAALWACGAYGRSYALRARDEIYHVCVGAALAAFPLWAYARFVTPLHPMRTIAGLAGAALTIAVYHVAIHAARYAGQEPPSGAVGAVFRRVYARERQRALRWKHAVDAALASIGLLVLSPAMLLAAMAIVAESNGPILFRQQRVGQDGLGFTLVSYDAGLGGYRLGGSRRPPHHARRRLPSPMQHRRAAPAFQRNPRRHVAGGTAARDGRVRSSLLANDRALRRAPRVASRSDRLGSDPTQTEFGTMGYAGGAAVRPFLCKTHVGIARLARSAQDSRRVFVSPCRLAARPRHAAESYTTVCIPSACAWSILQRRSLWAS